MRRLPLVLLLLAAGCAGAPRAWQNPVTGEFAPAEVISECQGAAQLEAQRSVLQHAGLGLGFGFSTGRGAFVPGWGWGYSHGSINLAILQRSQDLTAFCLRLKGFALLPVRPDPIVGPIAPAPAAPRSDARPSDARPSDAPRP